MNNPDIFWVQLQKLFTVVGQIDNSGRLVRASPLLARHCDWRAGDNFIFFESFQFKRPTSFDGGFESAKRVVGELFLGFSDELGFAVRGQVQDYSQMGLEGLCFVGVPWLWWIEGNATDESLTMSDFPVHDVQMDQMFFMSTQQSMVEDLQALNEQLGKAKKEVEQANEARQSFFHHVSHEMRTPLNGVISALGLMSDLKLEGKLAQYAQLASQSADRLLEVINFTLESASVESHVSDAEYVNFSLDEVLEECLSLASARAIEKNLELRRSGAQSFDRYYSGRLKLLRQVLGNLLGNAVKFSSSGTITLGASICPNSGAKEAQADTIEFSVADQGPGVPEEALPKLFQPFATGITAETRKQQGTGLGLSIVQRFVEALGGSVQVQSAVGEGTIFSFRVSLDYAPPDAKVERAAGLAVDGPVLFNGRVLLVEDNEINRMLNARVLESMGLNVSVASSGVEAHKLVAEDSGAFDLVFMDLGMPDIDGFEATRRIKHIAGAEQLPIVALTANTSARDRQLAAEAGMDGFLGKPVASEDLRKVLASHLATVSEKPDEQFDGIAPEGAGEPGRADQLVQPDHARPANTPAAQDAPEETMPVAAADEADPKRSMVFDREPIDRLKQEVGAEVLQTLVDKFLKESALRWESLSAALSQGDKDAIVREAHTLGSACLTFGVTAAGQQFRRCEAAAINDELPGEDVLAAIAPELADGIGQLQQLLSVQ